MRVVKKFSQWLPTCPGDRMTLDNLFGATILSSYAALRACFNCSQDSSIFPFPCRKVRTGSSPTIPSPSLLPAFSFLARIEPWAMLWSQFSGGCLIAQQTLRFSLGFSRSALGSPPFCKIKWSDQSQILDSSPSVPSMFPLTLKREDICFRTKPVYLSLALFLPPVQTKCCEVLVLCQVLGIQKCSEHREVLGIKEITI